MSPVRHSTHTPAEGPWDDPEEPLVPEVDLHGKRPDEALRHLARELHTARHRRLREVLVITGQGLGNALHKPILRGKVEQWLLGPEGRRLGVQGFERVSRGGALRVRLAGSGPSG
jgi:DNA-nicking Smr family endonuclease